jgi:hypothetical protein
MSGVRILSLAAAACVLLASTSPLLAQDFPAELSQHKPVAELASANRVNNNPEPAEWRQVPRTAPNKRYWKGIWIATWVAFVAVNVLDAHSSSGRLEGNPLLRDSYGVFSGRKALVVKSAAGGGFFALQCWLAHKNPSENYYKTFSVATGAATAALGAVAVRNYSVGKAADAQTPPVAPEYVLRKP